MTTERKPGGSQPDYLNSIKGLAAQFLTAEKTRLQNGNGEKPLHTHSGETPFETQAHLAVENLVFAYMLISNPQVKPALPTDPNVYYLVGKARFGLFSSEVLETRFYPQEGIKTAIVDKHNEPAEPLTVETIKQLAEDAKKIGVYRKALFQIASFTRVDVLDATSELIEHPSSYTHEKAA